MPRRNNRITSEIPETRVGRTRYQKHLKSARHFQQRRESNYDTRNYPSTGVNFYKPGDFRPANFSMEELEVFKKGLERKIENSSSSLKPVNFSKLSKYRQFIKIIESYTKTL